MLLRSHRRIPNAEERIEHRLHSPDAVELDAVHRQFDRECGRVWPLFVATLDCLVRDEPGVAAAAFIAPAGMLPAGDVALVLIWHAEREAIDRSAAFRGEMEDVFVAIVHVTRRVDRLEVTA